MLLQVPPDQDQVQRDFDLSVKYLILQSSTGSQSSVNIQISWRVFKYPCQVSTLGDSDLIIMGLVRGSFFFFFLIKCKAPKVIQTCSQG